MSCVRTDDRLIALLVTPETRGDAAQLLILFLPPRFQRPHEVFVENNRHRPRGMSR